MRGLAFCFPVTRTLSVLIGLHLVHGEQCSGRRLSLHSADSRGYLVQESGPLFRTSSSRLRFTDCTARSLHPISAFDTLLTEVLARTAIPRCLRNRSWTQASPRQGGRPLPMGQDEPEPLNTLQACRARVAREFLASCDWHRDVTIAAHFLPGTGLLMEACCAAPVMPLLPPLCDGCADIRFSCANASVYRSSRWRWP